LWVNRKGRRKTIRVSSRRSRNRRVTPYHAEFTSKPQTIAQFKEGIFNVLVSTSIGEEGLDIGEVDFVVIYDMPKQSIKLVRWFGPYRADKGLKCSCNVSEEQAENAMAKCTC